MTKPLSTCCGASVVVGGDEDEGTHYYVCVKCTKPCDVSDPSGGNDRLVMSLAVAQAAIDSSDPSGGTSEHCSHPNWKPDTIEVCEKCGAVGTFIEHGTSGGEGNIPINMLPHSSPAQSESRKEETDKWIREFNTWMREPEQYRKLICNRVTKMLRLIEKLEKDISRLSNAD